jgi:hypothetical protein
VRLPVSAHAADTALPGRAPPPPGHGTLFGDLFGDDLPGAATVVKALVRARVTVSVTRRCATTNDTSRTRTPAVSGRTCTTVGLPQIVELVYELLDALEEVA